LDVSDENLEERHKNWKKPAPLAERVYVNYISIMFSNHTRERTWTFLLEKLAPPLIETLINSIAPNPFVLLPYSSGLNPLELTPNPSRDTLIGLL